MRRTSSGQKGVRNRFAAFSVGPVVARLNSSAADARLDRATPGKTRAGGSSFHWTRQPRSEGGKAHFCSEDSAKMSQTPSVVVITLTCSVIVGQHSRERINGGRGGMPKMFQRLTQ